MKHCTNCGTQPEDEAMFCAECGQPQAAAPAPQVTVPTEAPKKKKSPLVPIIIIVAAVLLVVGGVVGALFGFGVLGGKTDNNKPASVSGDSPEDDESSNANPSIIIQAKEAIENGDYEKAYKLLKESNSAEAKAMLKKFAFVPVTETLKNSYVVEYEYDTNGNCVKMVGTGSDGGRWVFEYEYDKNDNCVKEVQTYSGGFRNVMEYEYDTNGNCVKMVRTDSDGDRRVFEYKYDKNDNCVKEVTTYSDGDRTVMEYEYEYDTNGNCVKKVATYSDGDRDVTEYEYDTNGNCIKEVTTDSDGDRTVWKCEYDEKGNCIKKVEIDSNGERTTHAYTWKLQYYPNGVPKLIQALVKNLT